MIDAVALVQQCLFERGSVVVPEVDGSTMFRSDPSSVRSGEVALADVLEVAIRRDNYRVRRCLVCLRRKVEIVDVQVRNENLHCLMKMTNALDRKIER